MIISNKIVNKKKIWILMEKWKIAVCWLYEFFSTCCILNNSGGSIIKINFNSLFFYIEVTKTHEKPYNKKYSFSPWNFLFCWLPQYIIFKKLEGIFMNHNQQICQKNLSRFWQKTEKWNKKSWEIFSNNGKLKNITWNSVWQ